MTREDKIFELAQSSAFYNDGSNVFRIQYCDEETREIQLLDEESGDECSIPVSEVDDTAKFYVCAEHVVGDVVSNWHNFPT